MSPGRLVDVSIAQHRGLPPGQGPSIDWKAVAGAGVTGLFLKATQGTTYVNEWLEEDLFEALGAGLDVICYHFAGLTNPTAEVSWFKKYAGPYARMLDYETNTNVAWARTFLQGLVLPPGELITYGSASTLKDFYAQLPSMAFPAAYNQLWPGWGVCWQFTDAAQIPGIPTAVDEDSWHGDESQYESLFTVTPPASGGLYSGGLMFDGLAASKEDNFRATLRFMWGQIRTDGITAQDFDNFWFSYNLPLAQGGFGGTMDSVVSNVIDQAQKAGTLRPAWAGAV